MLRQQGNSPTASTATAVVTVDPVGEEHRALFPVLTRVSAAYAIAVRRDSRLVDVDALTGTDGSFIPFLRERARMVADQLNGAYQEPCAWCGINCTPENRLAHQRLASGSETAYRARWAA